MKLHPVWNCKKLFREAHNMCWLKEMQSLYKNWEENNFVSQKVSRYTNQNENATAKNDIINIISFERATFPAGKQTMNYFLFFTFFAWSLQFYIALTEIGSLVDNRERQIRITHTLHVSLAAQSFVDCF